MRNLDLLIPRDEKPSERWTWATVTQADPLRIRLDGESAALDITPENLTGSLLPGERVWTQISGRRTLITGRAGGNGVPTGSLQMYMGETAPAGWLLCDGSTFDGNQYPVLADMLGGTTVPNFANRFPLGLFPGLTTIGQQGGSTEITEGQLPPHDHSINHDHANASTSSDSHSHSFMFETWDTTQTGGGGTALRVSDIDDQAGGSGANHTARTSTDGHSHSVDIPSFSGNSGSAGNGEGYWQPYFVVNYIIKT